MAATFSRSKILPSLLKNLGYGLKVSRINKAEFDHKKIVKNLAMVTAQADVSQDKSNFCKKTDDLPTQRLNLAPYWR